MNSRCEFFTTDHNDSRAALECAARKTKSAHAPVRFDCAAWIAPGAARRSSLARNPLRRNWGGPSNTKRIPGVLPGCAGATQRGGRARTCGGGRFLVSLVGQPRCLRARYLLSARPLSPAPASPPSPAPALSFWGRPSWSPPSRIRAAEPTHPAARAPSVPSPPGPRAPLIAFGG